MHEYIVRCEFTNRFGSSFGWAFQVPANDYAEAMLDAARPFFSGLTVPERTDAAKTFWMMSWKIDVGAFPK
jgi:hypothetical protein